MNDFRKNLGKKLDKYIKLNNFTYRSFGKNGLGNVSNIIRRGSTTLANLYDISVFLRIDIRNLLMFNDDTYEFESSFVTYEGFFVYIGQKFKNIRIKRELRAIDIDEVINRVYCFEGGRTEVSLKKFYGYLDKLGMTSDEFFLEGEGYSIKGATKKNIEELKYVEDELRSELDDKHMNDFRENLRNKLKKYIKLNNFTYRSFEKNGLGNISNMIKRGSTGMNNLFDISTFLKIDVRNLLVFSDCEYEFKNSFNNFEEFFLYIRTRFKNSRLERGLKVSDIDKEITSVYRFESGKKMISLKKFYNLLDVMGISIDDFFLENQKYTTKRNCRGIIKESLDMKVLESNDKHMNDFRENLRNKLKKYIKLNNFTYRSFRSNGLGDPSLIIKSGSTRFNNLFDIANFLNIDIRNLLMFDDNTYDFKNSFDSFEEFFIYIGRRFRDIRLKKGLRAIDFDKPNNIYAFEGNREGLSLKKLYEYIDRLGMTPDEFFLSNEKYEIVNSEENENIDDESYKVELTLEEIFKRVDELEEIRGVKIATSVIPTKTVMPTIHVFLNICKSLKVSPIDFLDLDNKNPDYKRIRVNNREFINGLRKTIKANSENSQKFLRLDNIYNYCKENNKDIRELFQISIDEPSENQSSRNKFVNMLYLK